MNEDDVKFSDAVKERMSKLMSNEHSAEIRETVKTAMETDQVFNIMINEDFVICGQREGILLHWKGEPFAAFTDTHETALFIDIFMSWTLCRTVGEVAADIIVDEQFEGIVKKMEGK